MTSTTRLGPPVADRIRGRLMLALIIICATQLMMVLDGTIVTVALPAIQRGLHLSTTDLVWVTTAYGLTYGGLLLIGGRAGDLFGRRRVFAFGLGVFTVASLVGGLAPDSTWLIVARAAQGIGSAAASPTALALIMSNFAAGRLRNKAMGAYAAMSSVGGALGQIAGGLFADLVGWRWIMFVNVPIGVAVLLLVPRALAEGQRAKGRLDAQGAAIVTAAMFMMVFGLTNASTYGWGDWIVAGPLLAACVMFAVFLLWEAKTPHAMLPLRIFTDRARAGTYALAFLIAASTFASFFFITLFFQNVQGYTPLRTGLSFLPIAGIVVVATQLSSRLVSRVQARYLLSGGVLVGAAGLAWLSRITADSSYLAVLAPLLLLWFGVGLGMVPMALMALAKVAPSESGIAAAVLNTGQQMGGAVGLAGLATLAVTVTRHDLAQQPGGGLSERAVAVATTHGYSHALLLGAGIAVLGFLVGVFVVGIGNKMKFGAGEDESAYESPGDGEARANRPATG
ncbi:MFS transporter [Dactylosporangium roseum]|uniref:MFS transporter n=1 Tax=Dactylosporangium roseum TaxID=47989 RepID=A0ABY5ZFZ4_9ACTN|nr:MFS transporter [Dactylosporangium roseum]UWZ39194.1 MFS transporter [Dactylosporangium roseum]